MLAKFFSVLVSGLTTAALVAGCTTGVGGTAAPEPSDSNPAAIGLPTPVLPPAAAKFDYQLGGAYDPPNGVTVVARDRLAPPSGAGYDICYINGFQTQPADSEAFRQAHPELLVQIDGQPVRDPKWTDEYIYDTSSPQNREALASLVAGAAVASAAAAPLLDQAANLGVDFDALANMLDVGSISDSFGGFASGSGEAVSGMTEQAGSFADKLGNLGGFPFGDLFKR